MSTPEPITIQYYNPAKFERIREFLQELHPSHDWDDNMVMGYISEAAWSNLRARVLRQRREGEGSSPVDAAST